MTRSAALLAGVYLHRLFGLAQSVRDGCNEIFDSAPVAEAGGYIKVSPELHAAIDAVLVEAANLKKLIITPTARGSSESARTFRFRRSRTEAVAELLDGLSIEAISDAQVRNSLEHFDEYLDKLGGRLASGGPPPEPIAAYNLALSSWAVVRMLDRGNMYPLRVYVADEHTYYNFERKINLRQLRDEADAILERLTSRRVLPDDGAQGGMLLVFPRT